MVLYHCAHHNELVDQLSGIECPAATGWAVVAWIEPVACTDVQSNSPHSATDGRARSGAVGGVGCDYDLADNRSK